MNTLEKYSKACKKNNLQVKNIKDINEQQIVNLVNVPIICYLVNYKYTTVRGNKKEGCKYFLLNSYNPNIYMEKELRKYVEEYNIKNPHRKLLNVKFLSSQCMGYITL